MNATVDANNHINTDSTYAYDAVGNMTKDGTGAGHLYYFDDEGHLTQASGFSGGPYCYVYDGNGLRVAKKSAFISCSSGTVTKLYWRSIGGDALAETDGTGSTTNSAYNEYVFFAGRRIASRNGTGAVFYFFADQLGSTRTITDANGNLCYDADFSPYGQEISYTGRLQTTACPPNYKFTGYERDPETGLDYAFARYYSSRLGRFLSTDPLGGSVGDLQSHNAYAYVLNNPLSYIDPFGLFSLCPDGSVPVIVGTANGWTTGPAVTMSCGLQSGHSVNDAVGACRIVQWNGMEISNSCRSPVPPYFDRGDRGGGDGPAAKTSCIAREVVFAADVLNFGPYLLEAQQALAQLTNSTLGIGLGGGAAVGLATTFGFSLGGGGSASATLQSDRNGNSAVVLSLTPQFAALQSNIPGGGTAANFGIQFSVSSQPLKPGASISGSFSGSYNFVGLDVNLSGGSITIGPGIGARGGGNAGGTISITVPICKKNQAPQA